MKVYICLECLADFCNKEESIEAEIPYIPSNGTVLFLTEEQEQQLAKKIQPDARFYPDAVYGESAQRIKMLEVHETIEVPIEDVSVSDCIYVKTSCLDLRDNTTFIMITSKCPL